MPSAMSSSAAFGRPGGIAGATDVGSVDDEVTPAQRSTDVPVDRPVPALRQVPRHWSRWYALQMAASDAVAAALAVTIGLLTRFGPPTVGTHTRAYALAGALLAVWLVAIHASGGYEAQRLSVGAEEFKRVLRGTGVLVGAIAVFGYATNITEGRRFVAVIIPVGLVAMLVFRLAGRKLVHRRRRRAGTWTNRILAVGTAESIQDLVVTTARAPWAGLQVVGACVDDGDLGARITPGVPVVARVCDAAEAAAGLGVDVVAVAGTGIASRTIRQLGWQLEGSGRSLVMAPGLTEVAGPRVHVSPVEGLPLMWVDQPQFTGFRRAVKRLLDLTVGALILVLTVPLVLVVAVAVKVTSPGPVFFRHRRVGTEGREFVVYKFRSMYRDADLRLSKLMSEHAGGDAIWFKLREDPRVTPVGRFLRRFSLDEIPQVLNVMRGEMSLVGPRPQVQHEVALYDEAIRRRLLVKPGLTGLWQVSGRSDLSFEDSVRLDLFYVENWSLSLDLAIMARTAVAVLRSRGAY